MLPKLTRVSSRPSRLWLRRESGQCLVRSSRLSCLFLTFISSFRVQGEVWRPQCYVAFLHVNRFSANPVVHIDEARRQVFNTGVWNEPNFRSGFRQRDLLSGTRIGCECLENRNFNPSRDRLPIRHCCGCQSWTGIHLVSAALGSKECILTGVTVVY